MEKIITTLLILACIVGYAQEGYEAQDPKAKEILKKVSDKTKSYKSISVDFTYKIENKSDGIDESQKGKLTVKGKKYKLDIVGQQIINNGKTIWTYIEDADEVQINSVEDIAEEEDNLMNPATIFTIYEKGFKYKYVSETTENGVAYEIINLYPEKSDKKPFHTIVLFINKLKKQISRVIVKSKDGNIYTYIIDKFTPNTTLSDESFNFDVSKVSEVIDLRE